MNVRELSDAELAVLADGDVSRGFTAEDCLRARLEVLLRHIRRFEESHPHLPSFDEGTLPSLDTWSGLGWFPRCQDIVREHLRRMLALEERLVGQEALSRAFGG